jgi:ribosomal protein L11 methyltransferase
MYLWQKATERRWLRAREQIFQTRFGHALSIISRPDCKRVQIEIACKSRNESRHLVDEFGGRAQKLPRNWLKQFEREQRGKPLKIGGRLTIVRGSKRREAVSFPYRLIIPAGSAFGTGEHPTTAMCLLLLEEITRKVKPKFVVDLGTGSGILALAAKRFGARHTWAIDSDTTAISTAKQNARINRIDNIKFLVADVCRWKFPVGIDIITANLFSELLIELLPKLKRIRWLILSGILRAQEKRFVGELRRNKIDIAEVRRRGKWIAILAQQLRPS